VIHSARRLSLPLVLGAAMFSLSGFAMAQTSTGPTGPTTNGVTGTDPCPKNVSCSTSSAASSATGNGAGAAIQTLLIVLGLA